MIIRKRRSDNVGFVVPPQIDNNIGIVKGFSNSIKPIQIKSNDEMDVDDDVEIGPDINGEGFRDIIKNVYNKGKEGVSFLYKNRGKIADAYSGDVGTALKNLIPSSDDTGRPSYVGEKHGILELKNGKYGVANYMGPNTNLLERLRRGDPPRTEVDKASMAHDIRYALAKTPDDIRRADNIMMNAVDRIALNKTDSIKNITQARLIKAKVIGEDLGLIRRDAFSGDLSNKQISDIDRITLMSKIGSLAHEGYGMKQKILPGDALKLKILKQMVKEKKMKFKGSGGMMDFISGKVIPNLMKKVGIPQNIVPNGFLKNIISKSMEMVKDGNMSSIIDHLSKTILPLLANLKSKSMGGNGIMTAGYGKKKPTLIKALSKGLKSDFKQYIKGSQELTGRGLMLSGSGGWEDFKRGFLSVFKPGAKILGQVASALGQPEIGIPLSLLADNL